MKNNKISSLVFNSFTNDSRVLKEAITLKNNGFNISIVAHLDSGLLNNEIVEGVRVLRVSFLDRKTASITTKVIAYLKYIHQAIKLTKDSDFIHAHDLNTMPIAVYIKLFLNKSVKIIYDAHEYETQMNNLSKKGKKIMYFFEKRLIKYADKIITVSHSIALEYKKLYPTIETPSLILNCPNYTEISKGNKFREKFKLKDEVTIFLYQGSLNKGRGLEIIVKVFKEISNKKNVLVMMGYGNLEDYAREQSAKEENIYFHEAVSPHELMDYTSSADVGIATIENSCLSYYYCLPNKMFEYIMAEIPIIVSNLPEMKKIVRTEKIGVVLKKNSSSGILKAITEINQLDIKVLKSNLKKTKKKYNWQQQEKELLSIYNNLRE